MYNTCVVCFNESETLCQRCRTNYCSRKCQMDDWPVHKLMCIPMPVFMATKKYQKIESHNQRNKFQLNESDASLRPPKTKLPCEKPAEMVNVRKSFFENPFKRNSGNISFKSNEVKNLAGGAAATGGFVIKRLQNCIEPTLENDIKTKATSFPSTVKSLMENDSKKIVPAAESIPEIRETSELKSLPRKLVTVNKPQSISAGTTMTMKEITLNEPIKEVVASPQRINEAEHFFTVKDIEVVPLPQDETLLCSDSSNLAHGYISSCINDEKAVALADRLNDKIFQHCERIDDPYRPRVDELCLCKFEEDNNWYRATVSKVVDAETFEIIFIDFGNSVTVASKAIRKMSPEFMHPCLVNKCYIKGFPDHPTADDIVKMQQFFGTNPIFEVKELTQRNGSYEILI